MWTLTLTGYLVEISTRPTVVDQAQFVAFNLFCDSITCNPKVTNLRMEERTEKKIVEIKKELERKIIEKEIKEKKEES